MSGENQGKPTVSIHLALLALTLSAAFAALAWPAQEQQPVIMFNDLGDEDDTDPTSGLFFLPGTERWLPIVCHENPDLPDGWEMYTSIHAGQAGWVSFRIVVGDHYGDFEARTQGLELTPEERNATPLYLAVRYKDAVLSPELDAYYGRGGFPHEGQSAGVYAFTGRPNEELLGYPYVRLGELGGRNDKVWRTGVYQIPSGTLQRTDRGFFQFSLGFPESWGKSSLYGDLRVDWLKLSNAPIEPEPDREGFWPAAEASRFVDLPKTGFVADGEPFFPIILDVNDGASSAREDSFQLWRETGFNVIGYYENAHGAYGGGGRTYWGYKAPFVEGDAEFRGFGNFLDECQQHGLKGAIFLWNSLRQYWILNVKGEEYYQWADDPLGGTDWRRPDGTFAGMADQIFKVVAAYKDHPAYFGINIKDEIDHEAPEWGSPIESIRYLYAGIRSVDPDHPQWVNLMGYRRLMWLHCHVSEDGIESFDRYPDGVTTPFSQVGEWMEEVKRQKGEVLTIPILSIMDQPPVDFNVRTATWISLVHGAQGLNYFVYQKDSLQEPEWWARMKAMLAQVNAVVPALHRSTSELLGWSWATTLGTRDYYHIEHRTFGELATGDVQIDAMLRRHKATGQRYLFAINTYPAATHATLQVAGLEADTPVEVLFEGRTLSAGQNGITDDFAEYEHHVYRF